MSVPWYDRWGILRWSRQRDARQSEAEWDTMLDDYIAVYGCDPAPFWAHRPEWQYHPGVEIDQYRNGH